MRHFMAIVAFAIAAASASLASAQPIVTADPGRYAAELSNNMAVGGIAPLRALFTEMYPTGLPTNVEAALITFERAITVRRAIEARVIEDVTLADSFRTIYLYHYYGSTYWVFTRVDFVRIGDEWALSGASFGSDWTMVAMVTTPDFHPSGQPPRR